MTEESHIVSIEPDMVVGDILPILAKKKKVHAQSGCIVV